MNSQVDIRTFIDQVQHSLGTTLEYDEALLEKELTSRDKVAAPLYIKILSILGGFLGTLAFLGFLVLAGLYDSEFGLVLFGLTFIIAALWINKVVHSLLLDTASISVYVVGYAMVAFGLDQMGVDENLICILLIFSAILVLYITENFILVFFSVLIISGGFIFLIVNGDGYNVIHFYNVVLAFSLTAFYLYEAKIVSIKSNISRKYSAIRMGLIFSFIIGLIFLGVRGITPLAYNYVWISSIFNIICVTFVILRTLTIFDVQQTRHKVIVLGIVVMLLLPTIFSPAISGAILLILLNYKVSYKTGVVIGVIAFIYFVSQFYYDLNLTLLVKSIILFVTGAMFLLFYFLLLKYFKSNEKI